MSTSVSIRPDGVAVISLQNPPVNSLSSSVMKSLVQNLFNCSNNPQVKGIVLTGGNSFFCGGAEITEFEMAVRRGVKNAGEQIHQVIDVIDQCPKTVVAAINGMALGGGCELTMACHYRLAVPSVKIGLPEVNLGLLPGGQGTQRLPRLVGMQQAMQMMLTGFPIPAAAAQRSGLLDQVVPPAKLMEMAAKTALRSPPRRVSSFPIKTADKVKLIGGALEMAVLQAGKMRKGQPAPKAIADCVRAAIEKKTFREGCEVEQKLFSELMYSTQSKALRHLFFSERLASKVEGMKKVQPKKLRKVGIIGAGLMGGGIAMCCVNKGIQVVLVDAKKEWLQRGMAVIQKNYANSVAKKKMKPDVAEDRVALISPTLNYEELKDCDIVVEAVYENLDLKKEIFKKLDKVCKKDALLCTNTSGLNIDEIARVTSRPESVMGTHFFSPANVMKLLENVKTEKASLETIATCMQFGKTIGKVSVLVGNCDGFVGNRMLAPYAAECRQMVEEGALPQQIDEWVVEDFHMAMGPIALGDLVGHDLFYRARQMAGNMQLDTKTCIGPHELVDWLCENQRFGQKAGKGFYTYRGREKVIEGEVMKAIEGIAAKKGMKRRSFAKEEVLERLFFPLINEGFKILEEGMAQKPSDIDIVYIYGYGFPPAKGGPMFYADHYVGLPKILERLKVYDAEAKERVRTNKNYRKVDYFEPSKLLLECVEKKCSLEDLWRKKMKAQKQNAKL